MKTTRFLALSLVACFVSSGLLPANSLAYNPFDTVAEATHKTLDWDDFKGAGKTFQRWDPNYSAYIVTNIRLTRYEVTTAEGSDGSWTATAPKAEAYGVMDKLLSGAASIAKTDSVLAHEQLHFDLTEAWARRLTLAIRTLEGHGSNERSARIDLRSKIDRAHQEFWQEVGDLQGRYDKETIHGTRKKEQKRWARQIAAWLLEHADLRSG